MEIKRGIAVSPGVAIATTVSLDPDDYRISSEPIDTDKIPGELKRLTSGFDAAMADVESLREATARQLGQDVASIFDFHYGLLKQSRLREQIAAIVSEQHHNAAHAAREVLRSYQKRFLNMEDALLRERVHDIRDIERRLLRYLTGGAADDLINLKERAILVAHDLTPGQSARLTQTQIVGVAMDAGGLTSHTAIVVRSMGIPAVMGLTDIYGTVASGDMVILDGTKGLAIIRPDEDTLREYRAEEQRIHAITEGLHELRDKPAETQDGVRISLWSNIEFPDEARAVQEKGADGIGLYRTEFLYLRSEKEPSEEDHYQAYHSVVQAVKGKPIIIRTLDLGADKYTPLLASEPENNPFLGLRSIRYCLQHIDLFKIQLRAILRVSGEGDVRVMFPLITSLMELRQAKMTLGDAMDDLEEAGVPFRRDIPVGIMIETPAAALQVRELIREVDFISIGTNDLIQYTLAVDRGNERVASLYTGSHPAILQTLREIIRKADRADIPCSLCGEMAGEPMYVMFLLGIGLRRFSMPASDVPEIKKIIRSTTIAHAERVARRVLTFDTDRQVSNYLRDEVRKISPEMI